MDDNFTFDITRIDNGLLLRRGGRPTACDPLAQKPGSVVYCPDAISLGEGVARLAEPLVPAGGFRR